MTDEDRLTRLEGMVEKLVRVALSWDERMDSLTEAQADSGAKIAALANAQIRTEDELREFQKNTEVKIAALADAQIQTQEALVKLTGNVAEIAGRMAELVGRVDELAGTMDELAESQKHTGERLDALIDIVRELRNGRQPPQP